MKKLFYLLFVLLNIFIFSSSTYAKNFYPVTAMIGGGIGALDKLLDADLNDGDAAILVLENDGTYGNAVFIYTFDATATDAESPPDIIRPDDYNTGVWELVDVYGSTIRPVGNILLTNGIDMRLSTTTSGHSWAIPIYDNDTGPAWIDALIFTNGNDPTVSSGAVHFDFSNALAFTLPAYNTGTITVGNGGILAQSNTTTAHTAIFAAVRDIDGSAYVNGIVGVNGDSPVMRYGAGSNYYEQDLTTGVFTPNGTAGISSVEVDRIPITAFTDGASPPAAAAVVSSADGRFNCRAFDGISNEDAFFTWKVPPDIDATQGIKFSVSGVVGSATAPANTEVVAFSLAGVSLGNSDAAGSVGTAQTSSLTADATYAQYDSLDTVFSSAITVTNLAAGETVSFELIRLAATTDTYAQDFHPHTILIKYVRLHNASF